MSIVLALLMFLLPACATEDSTNCVWSGSLHGNGLGRSFVALGPVTIYV